jgi:hypothetical protein
MNPVKWGCDRRESLAATGVYSATVAAGFAHVDGLVTGTTAASARATEE